MTKIFSKDKNDFYDDYAHHPTEIRSILEGVKNVYSDRKIISVFEPHRFQEFCLLNKNFRNRSLTLTLFFYVLSMLLAKKKRREFNSLKFAKLISKNSKTQVILIKSLKKLDYF